jgi:NhaA family Na+:H+ antiporter
MLSLAIVDDIGAILVVAIGYGGSLDFAALAFGGLGIAIVLGMGRLGIRSIPIYFLVGGLIWLAVDASGIHATVTGVILGLLAPTRRWVGDERLRAILDRVVAYPADHWERRYRGPQGAEVGGGRGAGGALAGRAAGNHAAPLGGVRHHAAVCVRQCRRTDIRRRSEGPHRDRRILRADAREAPRRHQLQSWLAVRSGIALRPPSLDWGMVAGGGMLAGIGFTMALFIAGLAFGDNHLNAAKLGILSASVLSAMLGTALLAWLSSSKRVGGRRGPPAALRQIIHL